jgi:hypothetical protein
MRSVRVSRFVFSLALPHGGHIWKENSRGFENTRLRCLELSGGRVAVMYQLRGNVGCFFFGHPTILPLDFPLIH